MPLVSDCCPIISAVFMPAPIPGPVLAKLPPLNAVPLEDSEYQVTGLTSGIWWFTVHSVNETGNAISISPTVSANINLIPWQPLVTIDTPFNEDGVMVVRWDASADATY